MTRNEAKKSIVDFVNSFDCCSNVEFIENNGVMNVKYDIKYTHTTIRSLIDVFDAVRDDGTCCLYTTNDDDLFLNKRFPYDWDDECPKKLLERKKSKKEPDLWDLLGIETH